MMLFEYLVDHPLALGANLFLALFLALDLFSSGESVVLHKLNSAAQAVYSRFNSGIKRRACTFFALFLLIFPQIAYAGPWLVGQQPMNYSGSHTLGDGSNSRGGQAPYYSANEPSDTATSAGIISQWKITCSTTDFGSSCGQYGPPVYTFTGSISGTTLTSTTSLSLAPPTPLTGAGITAGTVITSGSGTTWTVNNSQTVGSESMTAGSGHEAKARFDCNISFHEKNDPIVAPGVANGSTHDHSFFGALGFQGHAQDITYSGLRSGGGGGTNAGYSTCYGGPMNRTLYWEPSMIVPVNGVNAVLEPFTIVTYYVCGDSITPTGANYGPANCSRWPRGLDMIFGFDMGDPTGSFYQGLVNAANAAGGSYSTWDNSVTEGWYCASPATPSYTAYSPNQVQGSHQPYLNDGAGHETLSCNPTQMDGSTSCTIGTANCGYVITGDLSSGDCWDGYNPTSPNGRKHIIYQIHDNGIGHGACPDHWYLIPHFEAKPQFLFTSLAQLRSAYLSSDRMPGMTQWPGGQSLHADLLPSWDYGTGDAPGFMLSFFQHCLGLTMHVKNADGVTFTDLTGDPHECGFGRIKDTINTIVTGAPPDGLGPNPVVNLEPDQTGAKAYFPLTAGTALPGSQLHQKH